MIELAHKFEKKKRNRKRQRIQRQKNNTAKTTKEIFYYLTSHAFWGEGVIYEDKFNC